MNCIECHEPMTVPERPADPFLCPDCQEETSSVLVRTKFGKSSFARAVADVFTAGELTITATDTDMVVRTFPAGSWVSAETRDGRGNLLATYTGQAQEIGACIGSR